MIIILFIVNLLELIVYYIGSLVIIKFIERFYNWMLFFCNIFFVYIIDIFYKFLVIFKECKKKYYLNILKYYRCEEFV